MSNLLTLLAKHIVPRVLDIYSLLAATASATQHRIPADVLSFIERRTTCDHIRGENPEGMSESEAKEFTANLERYCRNSDRELAKLRMKYIEDFDVIDALRIYVTRI